MLNTISYIPAGDSALLLKFGTDISPETNTQVRKYLRMLDNEKLVGVFDLIPSYNELMVCYDPCLLDFHALIDKLKTMEGQLGKTHLPPPSLIEIPVIYGGIYGPDLLEVASGCGLPAGEVIRIHSAATYLVYMLGFIPGFCYLGGMDPRIAMPRKDTPRLMVPAGAVGIAGSQTGVYPIDSPGGWQIIGRTHKKLFDPGRNPGFLVMPGDHVRFIPVMEGQSGIAVMGEQ